MSLKNFIESKEKNNLTTKYIVPTRVIISENAENSDYLLLDTPRQALIGNGDGCRIHQGGYVVLDFGSELCGGISLTTTNIVKSEKNPYGSGCTYGKLRLV